MPLVALPPLAILPVYLMAKSDPRKLKQQAQAALDRGKHKKALELYLALEELEPTDGQWARRAADMYRRLNQKQQSVDALERAASKYMNAGFLVKAIAVCKMILQLDPTHSTVRDRLAELNSQRGINAPAAPIASTSGAAPPRSSVARHRPAVGPARPAPVAPVRPVPPTPVPIPVPPAPVAPAPIPVPPAPEPIPVPSMPAAPVAPTAPQAGSTRDTMELDPSLELDAVVEILDPDEDSMALPVPAPSPSRTPARPPPPPPTTGRPQPPPMPPARAARLPRPSSAPPVPPVPPTIPPALRPALATPPPAIRTTPQPAPMPARPGARPAPQAIDIADFDPDDDSDDAPIDLAALAAMAVQALDEDSPPDAPTPSASVRARTLPPDAPLDVIDLSELVPDAIELEDEIMSQGVIEIPIDLDDLELAPTISEVGERALHLTPLLSSLGPDAMQRLINDVELVDLDPGQVLFREGDEGRVLYVVAEGSVSVISEGPPRQTLSTLQEGDFFGEVAIVTNQVRSATVEANSERGASLLALDRNVIGNLVDEEPGVLKAILRFLRDRLVNRLIHTSPLFAPFTGPDARGLAGKFRFLEVPQGAIIMEQDKRASGLCIMLAGLASVNRVDNGQVRRLGQLNPGGIFGETSLLTNEPAPFTVRAESKSFILLLPGDVFREVIMTHPQVLAFISDLAEERQRRFSAVVAGTSSYDSESIKLI